MRLAIVGSTTFALEKYADDQKLAAEYIRWVLNKYQPGLVISGGAVGIDTMAYNIADSMGYATLLHLPESKNWKAYKKRNKLIAEDCTHLLAIRHRASTTYGSGWTADYAESLGKKVYRKYFG